MIPKKNSVTKALPKTLLKFAQLSVENNWPVATARKTRKRKQREGGSNFINVSIRFKLLLLLYNYENSKLYKEQTRGC